MPILNEDMKRVITEQRLGFVATTCEDGWPNLSPKGTMIVVDDDRIAFADLRSPQTRRNILRDGRVEVNFVDPFARRGYRFRAKAYYHDPGSHFFETVQHEVAALWPQLFPRVRGIVELQISSARILSTPAYDVGATEEELRAFWGNHFRRLHVLNAPRRDDPVHIDDLPRRDPERAPAQPSGDSAGVER
jgi:predicted pyridoxine 5'-phosphate oxidase superfamily flavin-nucleotide-binding protein